MRVLALTAALGLAAAVAYPLVTRQIAINREAAAAEWLYAIGEAQGRFRAANGGYAASLQSLVEPCGDGAAVLAVQLTHARIVDSGHEMAVRPASAASQGPSDCHGRATTSDFYVSARPLVIGRDGSRGLAMTSAGRVFLFFDGVPPTEADMAPGGLAMPLDAMSKIP